jgi:putative nucleotidyltransferase with HDIG domain
MLTQDILVEERSALLDWQTLSISSTASSEARLEETVLEGLPTLPSYVFELEARLKANPLDLKSVAWLIGTDPCLAAQVLRICHAMPFAKPVLHIEDALALAGKDRLQALAMTSPLLLSPETPGRTAAHTQRVLNAFWQHCSWTALLSERLAQWTGYPDPDKAYLAGLVHDIGKVPLMMEGLFAEFGEEAGDHHIEIGRLLAHAWNYPPELIEVLEFHHRPRQARLDAALTGIVAMADQYGERCGLGLDLGAPRLSRPPAAEVVELLHECLPGLCRNDSGRVAEALEQNLLAMLLALGQRLSSVSLQRPRY